MSDEKLYGKVLIIDKDLKLNFDFDKELDKCTLEKLLYYLGMSLSEEEKVNIDDDYIR